MSSDINEIRVSGVICTEINFKSSERWSVANFRIKSVRNYVSRGEQMVVGTYFSCSTFDKKIIEFLRGYAKGGSVLVTGMVENNKWRNSQLMKEGVKYPDSKQIVITNVEPFLEPVERGELPNEKPMPEPDRYSVPF